MNDRNIEDTRQPPDPPTHAPCDRCGDTCDVDDMVQFKGEGPYSGDLWLCEDCASELLHDRYDAIAREYEEEGE